MNQSAIALGVFDGLHKGHQEIFNILKSLAYKVKIILIFEPHPRKILSNVDVKYIMPLDIRVSEIRRMGFENIVVWQFSKEFSQTPGEEFMKNVLVKQYNCRHIVVGFNAHFGKGRDVTPDTLPKISRSTNINVTICASVLYDNAPISSTRIREAIAQGRLKDVSQMLGRNFFIEGNVVKGGGLGHKMGFPTINLEYKKEQVLPPVGVYFGYACIENTPKPAMINLGFRPTIEKETQPLISRPILEFHIVNENIDVTSKIARVEFLERIRDERKFESIEQLKQQLEKDKRYVIERFLK